MDTFTSKIVSQAPSAETKTTDKYIAEVAIGYKNGMWSSKSVEVDGPPRERFTGHQDVGECLLKQAVKEIEEDLKCSESVLFYHLISVT